MGLFDIGYSKQKSQSTQQSSSASLGSSFSEGSSQSSGQAGSSQSIAFEELFRSLYGDAFKGAAAVSANTGILQGEAAQLFSGGTKFLDMLSGGPANDYLDARLTGPDAAAGAQLNALSSSLGDFFNEQLLPGIKGRGIAAGTYGGARTDVAESLAAKQVAGQFSQGAASILANSQAQRDAAAATRGTQQIQSASAGLTALPSLFQLAQGGANAALSPYLALAQILGGPTTLTQSQSSQSASSADIARAISESFSSSYGQSTASGKSFNFGFGGFGAGAG